MICRQTRISVTLVVVVLWSAIGHAQASISAAEAKDHVGEKATICGEVISTHYAAKGRGNATFLNIDKSSPNQIFTVVIWGRDLPKFGDSRGYLSRKARLRDRKDQSLSPSARSRCQ
jgi:hypothetical protein